MAQTAESRQSDLCELPGLWALLEETKKRDVISVARLAALGYNVPKDRQLTELRGANCMRMVSRTWVLRLHSANCSSQIHYGT